MTKDLMEILFGFFSYPLSHPTAYLITFHSAISLYYHHDQKKFPIGRVCGECEDQRRGHNCAFQGGLEYQPSRSSLKSYFVFSGRNQWADHKEGCVDARGL